MANLLPQSTTMLALVGEASAKLAKASGEPTSRFAVMASLIEESEVPASLAALAAQAREALPLGTPERRGGRALLVIAAIAAADAGLFANVEEVIRELHFAADALQKDIGSGALAGLKALPPSPLALPPMGGVEADDI